MQDNQFGTGALVGNFCQVRGIATFGNDRDTAPVEHPPDAIPEKPVLSQ
jgi:hypothetical protein